MTGPEQPPTHEERNRFILRRTLSAISHLFAAWSLLFAYMVLAPRTTGEGLLSSRMTGVVTLGHALFLGAAGWALWRPRRGAWAWTGLAVAGSLAILALDLYGRRWNSLPVDLMYPLAAVMISLQLRTRA